MKFKNLSTLFVFIAGPVALLASSATDRKIEDAAKASYNYRTVLEDHVKVKAHDGVVTLTGTVAEASHKSLAEDTVEGLPGVTSVNNQLKIKGESHAEHSDGWLGMKVKTALLFRRREDCR